jgi:hypothetical protein
MQTSEHKTVNFVLFMKEQINNFIEGNIKHDGKHHIAFLLNYKLFCLPQRNLADSSQQVISSPQFDIKLILTATRIQYKYKQGM